MCTPCVAVRTASRMAGRRQVRYRRGMAALRKSMATRITLDEFLTWNPGDPGAGDAPIAPSQQETVG
jgi:hypothetical protein